jgi:putative transposase
VSESGYYAARLRTVRASRVVDRCDPQIHLDSRGTYGSRRVHAELTLGHGLVVGYQQVTLLMRRAGIQGLSGRPRWKRVPKLVTAADLVDRQFSREGRDLLWVTDITDIPPARARSTAPWSLTPTRGGSLAGPSTPPRPPRW